MDSATFSVVPGPGLHKTVRFPWFQSPWSQILYVFHYIVASPDCLRTRIQTFLRTRRRALRITFFVIVEMLSTKRVQIRKFINRRCLLAEGGGYSETPLRATTSLFYIMVALGQITIDWDDMIQGLGRFAWRMAPGRGREPGAPRSICFPVAAANSRQSGLFIRMGLWEI